MPCVYNLEGSEHRASDCEASIAVTSEAARLDAWRKKGAYGKGQNFVVHVNRSVSRR